MVKTGNAKLTKLFERLAYTQSRWQVFNDFLDFSLISFNWIGQQDFTELRKRYDQEGLETLMEMLKEYSDIADNGGEGMYDGLGDLYMEYMANKQSGQFFTPTDLCVMMAQMVLGDAPADGMSIYDPSCGSGRTLLAAAKMNRNMVFYGGDIDLTCCKMAVLNMLVNTLEGEIAWMNSLSMEHWKSWHLKKFMMPDGKYFPYYIETGPGETRMIERIKNTMQSNTEDIKVGKKSQIMLF